MSDQKSWLWRKKSSEKTIVVTDKADVASGVNNQEIQELVAEKAELERNLRDLTNHLSSVISESNAKDDLVKKHAKTAQDALAGWEKAEAKALSLKQDLDEAFQHRESSEDKIHHLDAALKECTMQLRFVREEQERRIHDVLLKASRELEETKLFLEEKLFESGKTITKLSTENSQLNEVLFLKDKLIDELNQQTAKAEGDVKALIGRMEMIEKENNSLLYEVRILEKEVDIRNEEREFNRRASDAAHKQHLENVKKIAKLESECQRLRVLVRKRLPGPAAVAKMKSEVGLLQRDSMSSNRWNKSNSNVSNFQFGYIEDGYPESPVKKINFLTKRISSLEEENFSLRETLTKKTNELQVSKSSQLKGQTIGDIRRSGKISQDLYSTSMSDVGSDDKVSCAGSSASALVSELEQFKEGGKSEINHLMNDFLEMEKLALVCVDKPDDSTLNSPIEITGKELVPVSVPSTNDSNCEKLESDMSISISKLIEIIEGMSLSCSRDNDVQAPSEKNETSMESFVRVFQWKTSELALVSKKFLHTCEDLLHGRTNFEKFTQELTSSLEWIINHCFSLQDVSCINDAIKKRFEFDDSRSESEIEARTPKIIDYHHNEMKSNTSQESKSLREQLQKSETVIASLEAELKAMQDSKVTMKNRFENHKMNIEDLNSQMKALMSELEKANLKLTSQDEELKNKVNRCEGLESKCRDLQLQLDRMTKMDTKEHINQEEKQLRTEMDIAEASEKLVECQETILHLGKQIKELTSSRDIAVSDKFISTPTTTDTAPTMTVEKKLTTQRSSLLDQMLAEDDAETEQLESPKTKEMIISKAYNSDIAIKPNTDNVNECDDEVHVGSLAIVPIKKQVTTSGGLFKKLLWRKKKGNGKRKMQVTFGA